MNLPQETLGLRRPCFSHGSRYSYRHSLFCEVHQCSRSGFNPHTMLLYRCLRIPLLRCRVLAPLHFRRWITRPVSYYALFECVAASKPTSWLSVQSNILSHLTRTWGPNQTSVEKGGDDLWIAEKFQSNPEIAGSPRNSFRASLMRVLWR